MSKHFVIVGAQRSGTSYLYKILDEHPEIEMAKPMRPEPKFFFDNEQFERGLDFYSRTYFRGKHGAWLKGEKSTSYIESEKAAQRIASNLPKVKLVFILRNPVERAVSNYHFSVQNGLENRNIQQAIMQEAGGIEDYDKEKVSVSPFAYMQRGRYVYYLDMYRRYFPMQRMIILQFEKLIGNAEQVSLLYEMLGVDSQFRPASIADVANASRPEKQPCRELPDELAAYMRDYFEESNSSLQANYGVETSLWDK